jgi:hypothetical protein
MQMHMKNLLSGSFAVGQKENQAFAVNSALPQSLG